MQAPVNVYLPAVVLALFMLDKLRKGHTAALVGIALVAAWALLVTP